MRLLARAWDWFGWAGVGLLILLAVAVIGPALVAADPAALSSQILTPPSAQHRLGTDELGRDVLAQLIYGTRVSLGVGVAGALLSTLLAIVVGAVAGYFGAWVDVPIMRVSEVFQVVPSIVLAAVVASLTGPGIDKTIFVIAILSWPPTARVVRGEVLRIKTQEYVDVARCHGDSAVKILVRDVIPNAVRPVVAVSTLAIGFAILLEASLGFLGLGPSDVPSWGRLLNSGQRFIFRAWWLSAFAGLAIFMTVMLFNVLGDRFSRMLDPRQSAR